MERNLKVIGNQLIGIEIVEITNFVKMKKNRNLGEVYYHNNMKYNAGDVFSEEKIAILDENIMT